MPYKNATTQSLKLFLLLLFSDILSPLMRSFLHVQKIGCMSEDLL